MSDAELFRLRINRPGLSGFISFTGLDHMYTTWWFLGIVFLFSLNIALNLYERVKMTVRQVRNGNPPSPERIKGLPFQSAISLPQGGDENIRKNGNRILSEAGYRVEEYPDGFIASKGRPGIWNASLFHVSLLVVLLGVLVSGLTKFGGNLELSEGQVFGGKTEELINRWYGILKIEPDMNFSVVLKKFNVEYWDAEYPKLFRSVVDVIEGGKIVLSKNIEMNEPLRYKGYSFYQLKYYGYSASLSIKDKNTGNEVRGYVNFPYRERYSGVVSQNFMIPHTDFRAVLRFDIAYPGIIVISVLSGNTPVWEGVVPQGGSIDLGSVQIVFQGIVKWTGLFASRDRGVPVVYAGFALLILSVFGIVFVVPKTFYAFYDEKRILVGAKTSRDKEVFREEFEEIVGRIRRAVDE